MSFFNFFRFLFSSFVHPNYFSSQDSDSALCRALGKLPGPRQLLVIREREEEELFIQEGLGPRELEKIACSCLFWQQYQLPCHLFQVNMLTVDMIHKEHWECGGPINITCFMLTDLALYPFSRLRVWSIRGVYPVVVKKTPREKISKNPFISIDAPGHRTSYQIFSPPLNYSNRSPPAWLFELCSSRLLFDWSFELSSRLLLSAWWFESSLRSLLSAWLFNLSSYRPHTILSPSSLRSTIRIVSFCLNIRIFFSSLNYSNCPCFCLILRIVFPPLDCDSNCPSFAWLFEPWTARDKRSVGSGNALRGPTISPGGLDESRRKLYIHIVLDVSD